MCFMCTLVFFFFFQAEDGIRDHCVTGVQTCALPICQGLLQSHGVDPNLGERRRTVHRELDPALAQQLREARERALDQRPHALSEGVERSGDRKSTRLNSSHTVISYAVFCLKKKKKKKTKNKNKKQKNE